MQKGKPKIAISDAYHSNFMVVISRHGVRPDPWKLKGLMEMSFKNKKWTKHSLE